MNTEVDNIVTQATGMFFSLGVRSVSMDDIAKELGISKKTLYQYFDSKELLVQGTIERFIEEENKLLAHFQVESEDALDEMIQIGRYVVTIFSRIKPALLHDLQKYYTNTWITVRGMQSDTIARSIETNISRGQSEGLYREELHPAIITRLYVQKSMALTSPDVFPEMEFDSQKLIEEHIIYHLYGILSDKGRQLLAHRNFFE